MKKNVNAVLLVFVILGTLYYLISPEIAIVFFVGFCQFMGFYSIIKELAIYRKTKKGPLVVGTIENVVDVHGDSDSEGYFEVEISFSMPSNNEKVVFKQKMKSINNDKEMLIWVNDLTPSQSVAIDKYDLFWKVNIVVVLIVLIALFYVNYLILTGSVLK